MRRKRVTEERIAFALRQAEPGTSVAEVCRKMGVPEPSFDLYGHRLIAGRVRRSMATSWCPRTWACREPGARRTLPAAESDEGRHPCASS
jgi:hypothetical protein